MSKTIRLAENQFGEMMAYHGSGADFDKFNHKKYLSTGAGSQYFGWGTYVTNDMAVADGYVKASKGNAERDFFLNLVDPRQYLESLGKYDEEIINEILKAYNSCVVRYFKADSNATFASVQNSISGLVNWFKSGLSVYLPLDKVIKMYNEDPRFSNMSYAEKEKEIENHKKILLKKERPVIVHSACLDILNHFKPEMEKYKRNRFAYLYEVDIPDDNGFNYLPWYEGITTKQASKIKNGIDYLEKRYNHPIISERKYNIIIYPVDEPLKFEEIYNLLKESFGSQKAVSLFLMYCGFDGIKYPAGTRWGKPDGASEDAYNYVVFDANKVKIINKTRI